MKFDQNLVKIHQKKLGRRTHFADAWSVSQPMVNALQIERTYMFLFIFN